MSKPSRLDSARSSQTYFITSNTDQKKSVFQSEQLAKLFLTTLFHYRAEQKFRLHSFVLMPNHFHLLITPAEEMTLERALQLIKGGYSFRVKAETGKNFEIWQRGFTDRRVRDAGECRGIIECIHQNPVKEGLVVSPELYPHSSAYPGFVVDPLPLHLTSAAKAAGC